MRRRVKTEQSFYLKLNNMTNQTDPLVYKTTWRDEFYEDKLECFTNLVSDALASQVFPGLDVLMFRGKEILYREVFGYKELKPQKTRLEMNSIFDVASMTKTMVTGPLIMILLEQGKLNLSTRISSYFSEFNTDDKRDITIKHLLTHSSGLPDWHNLHENMDSLEEAKKTLLNLPLEYSLGSKALYSCMGFIILKLIIELICEKPIDEVANDWLLKPLGMKNSCFNPPKELWGRIPATGECSWRNRIITGEVHDENSHFFNGLGGNAGLFSTAHDVAIFSNMLLDKGLWNGKRILSPASINLMVENHTNSIVPRGLAFNLQDQDYDPGGELFGERSFGHTGFTGTSFWMDPDRSLGIIMLTNRVHISYRGNIVEMKSFRMKAHNILLSALKK